MRGGSGLHPCLKNIARQESRIERYKLYTHTQHTQERGRTRERESSFEVRAATEAAEGGGTHNGLGTCARVLWLYCRALARPALLCCTHLFEKDRQPPEGEAENNEESRDFNICVRMMGGGEGRTAE